jgi:integrase
MAQIKKPVKTTSLGRGEGSIVKKAGSPCLYLNFRYLCERVVISTGLIDTRENRHRAREILLHLRYKIDSGTFKFSEAFPMASPRLKALFAAKESVSWRHGRVGTFT